jgi:hypothetical protein
MFFFIELAGYFNREDTSHLLVFYYAQLKPMVNKRWLTTFPYHYTVKPVLTESLINLINWNPV